MTSPEFDIFLNALPIPALVIGADARLLGINASARQVLGGDGTGRHYVTALRQPDAIAAVEGCLRDRLRHHAAFTGREGGRETAWRLDVAPLDLPGLRAVLVGFTDLTEMDDARRMRRDFVANVSHEMRTPITALAGFIETLRGPARDDAAAQARFLEIMARETARMTRLVDDLLSLGRIEEDERVRPTAPVALDTLVGAAIAALEPLAAARSVTLAFSGPEAMPTVPGDAAQLRQVLVNLIENAIKYGREGGTVTVRLDPPARIATMPAPAVRLSVQDEGEGIAARHIPRLTERFYRVDDHRSRAVGGTGLGLAIVSHIVERHRGRLKIESRAGQGSVVSVLLPASLS